MTREEKLQKAHQMFDNRKLLTELKWQRQYFNRGYVSKQEELFNLWIFDECIKALEQEPCDYKALYENYLKKSAIVIEQLRADRDRLLEDIDKIRAEISTVYESLDGYDPNSLGIFESRVNELIDNLLSEQGE